MTIHPQNKHIGKDFFTNELKNGDRIWSWINTELVRMLITEEEHMSERLEGANPETCLHNIVQAALGSGPHCAGCTCEHILICASCDATLDQSFWDERTYEYDISYDVWVYVPKSRSNHASKRAMDI